MNEHIIQSPQWAKFKEKYGTPFVKVGKVHYFKHKIPASPFYYAYCPKVNPFEIDFEKIEKSIDENDCIAINFDSPNVVTTDEKAGEAIKIFEEHCIKAPRNTFTKNSAFLGLIKSEDELLKNMHKKHRYNIKYAERKGVTVEFGKSKEDLEKFLDLMYTTTERQHYYTHPRAYYETLWKTIKDEDFFTFVTAKYEETPLVSWILFTYQGVLYYPFGGSSNKFKNLQASSLVGWEAIKYGKEKGCKVFDMWGIGDSENHDDHMQGVTNFKLRFGSTPVTYIDSYDFVVNKPMYSLFNLANDVRWALLEAKRNL